MDSEPGHCLTPGRYGEGVKSGTIPIRGTRRSSPSCCRCWTTSSGCPTSWPR